MKLFLSLDTIDPQHAKQVLEQTQDLIDGVKIGHIPLTMGTQAVQNLTKNIPLFLDVKLHDIPSTMVRAIANYQQLFPHLAYFTFWGTISPKALSEIVAVSETALPLAVVSLSSDEAHHDHFFGIVEQLLTAGINHCIAPSEMIAPLRNQFGNDIGIYVPGIRLSGRDDHHNPATPKQAHDDGATAIIVGRPIIFDPKPRIACQKFLDYSQQEDV